MFKTTITVLLALSIFSAKADMFNGYLDPILEAAYEVQVNPVLLVAIAHKETNFRNVRAKAGGTAEGLFQFNDVTWEHVLNKHGEEFNIDLNASKYDVRANSLLGAIYVRENEKALTELLKRSPTLGELYMSHLLGPTGVRRILTANKNAIAANVVSYAYPRNKPLFKTKEGKLRTVGQFRDYMNWKFNELQSEYEEVVVSALMEKRNIDIHKADVDYVINKFYKANAPKHVTLALTLLRDTKLVRDVVVPYVLNNEVETLNVTLTKLIE